MRLLNLVVHMDHNICNKVDSPMNNRVQMEMTYQSLEC